nr:DNA-directed DNA polymerase [Tanacetum cinerariifolium]
RGDFSKQEENLRRNINDDMRNILSSFFQNQPSTSGTLSSNTIPNPKGEMKAVTTRSGLAYEGPSIPTESLLEKVDEQVTEEILDKENSNSSGRASINLMPLSIWKNLSLPELTPTRMTLELADRSITRPKGVPEDVFVKVGKFYFPTDFVVVDFEADPRVPLILGRSFLRTDRALIDVYGEEITLRYNPKSSNPTLVYDDLISESNANPFSLPPMDLKVAEESKEKSSVEEPPELELKEFPSHLEYVFLEDSNKLPVIIAKNLKVDEREALINVLKSHKWAIGRKISDIEGIHPSPWVSPIHYVPKKGGMTVVANKNNELILTRLVTGWRVCIDYRTLNDATRKDHFSLPFMDQMLERLAWNEFYCFLDGFSGYFQIPIDP